MGEPERRRRRLRPSSSVPAPAPPTKSIDIVQPTDIVPADFADGPRPAIEDPADEQPRPGRPVRTRPISGAGTDAEEPERGLRGLVGSGSSQVGLGAALRARDAARPSEKQVADAEASLIIVRRNWTPREELPRNR